MSDQYERAVIARELKLMSCNNETANGAAILQAVAAWLIGKDVFDPPAELWEHADRLCGGISRTCEKCGGLRIGMDEPLCCCGQTTVAGSVCSILDGVTVSAITPPTNADIGLTAEITTIPPPSSEG